jgi:hypothetical protein
MKTNMARISADEQTLVITRPGGDIWGMENRRLLYQPSDGKWMGTNNGCRYPRIPPMKGTVHFRRRKADGFPGATRCQGGTMIFTSQEEGFGPCLSTWEALSSKIAETQPSLSADGKISILNDVRKRFVDRG